MILGILIRTFFQQELNQVEVSWLLFCLAKLRRVQGVSPWIDAADVGAVPNELLARFGHGLSNERISQINVVAEWLCSPSYETVRSEQHTSASTQVEVEREVDRLATSISEGLSKHRKP
jgi:hypothetical protein